MDSAKPFPILRLPFLSIEEVFKAMDPIEMTKVSVVGPEYMTACSFLFTSNKEKNGKVEESDWDDRDELLVWKYSDNLIEEWKQLCVYVLEVFKKQTMDLLSMTMDAFVNQNVSIIDFLKTNVKSVDDCYLYQMNNETSVDDHTAYLVNNITISSKLYSLLHIKNKNYSAEIPKNLKKLHVYNSQWIGCERLLEIDCESVILERNQISNEEWNSFLKKWIAMETNQNLGSLELGYRELDEFRDHVLHDIPYEVVSEEISRIVRCSHYQTQNIRGGIDIHRIDGKTATFFVRRSEFKKSFMMCVH